VQLLIAYALTVGAVTLAVVIATWPPRPWPALLLSAGPVVSVLAVAEVWPFDLIGWIAVLGVAYLYLVAPPLIPWRRRWARYLVPATCLFVCAGLVIFGGGLVMAVYLALPILCAAGAIIVAVLDRPQRV
jgi:hypothetical protein